MMRALTESPKSVGGGAHTTKNGGWAIKESLAHLADGLFLHLRFDIRACRLVDRNCH